MKAMEGGHSAEGLNGDTGGRHTRALAKRCIVLTEENRVTILGKHPTTTNIQVASLAV